MDTRNRIYVTLSPRDMEVLRWLASERTTLPGTLANRLMEDAIARELSVPAVRDAYQVWVTGESVEQIVQADIVAAMSVPGVVNYLAGREDRPHPEIKRAASYLTAISAWLEDPRGLDMKGGAPRLALWNGEDLGNGTIGHALQAAGGADGATVRQAHESGVQTVSDKRQISDTSTSEAHLGRARRSGHA